MSEPRLPAHNIFDLRDLARRRLPKGIFEYMDRGSEDEVALRNNRSAFAAIKLQPRVARDVSAISVRTEIFGKQWGMPLGIAPTGFGGLMWYQGELALARAAAKAEVPFTLATRSTTSLERVASEAGGHLWFQLYINDNRKETLELVERARVAGFHVLAITLDTPVSPNREYNAHNGFELPFRVTHRSAGDVLNHPRWLFGVLLRYLVTTGMPRNENAPGNTRDKITKDPLAPPVSASVDWEVVRTVRKAWPGPLLVKGVLHPDDARAAIDLGLDGVIVSNHGGRNNDSTPAPIEVLPHIADAVGHRATVLLDSGIRRGSDVAKALALGAKAVLAGRAPLYGAAAGGEEGVALALGILRKELVRTMAMTGCRTLDELGPGVLYR